MISVKLYNTDGDTHKCVLTLEESETAERIAVCTPNEVVEVDARELFAAVRFMVEVSK